MVTKDLLKAEIDRVPEEHLGVLYKIVRALEEPAEKSEIGKLEDSAWKALLNTAYGSTADAPIERGEHFARRRTGRDLADLLPRVTLSESTLDAIEAVIEERRREVARAMDL